MIFANGEAEKEGKSQRAKMMRIRTDACRKFAQLVKQMRKKEELENFEYFTTMMYYCISYCQKTTGFTNADKRMNKKARNNN